MATWMFKPARSIGPPASRAPTQFIAGREPPWRMVDAVVLDHRDPIAEWLEKGALGLVLLALVLTGFLASQLVPPPNFHTDLSAFAPESDADVAADRMAGTMQGHGERMFVQVTAVDGGNVLSWHSIQQQSADFEELMSFSENSSGFIRSETTAPGILSAALEETTDGASSIADTPDWETFLANSIENGTDCSTDGADERLLTAAATARSAMLHRNFEFKAVCDWLGGDRSNPPVPTAQSTLWVIEVRDDLEESDRIVGEVQLRDLLVRLGSTEGSVVTYSVISDGLISHEINSGSLGELVRLLVLAVLTVVGILAFAFRSFRFVAFPLAALSAALIWTYGAASAAGASFSILEVAVAPVVLGLGIDYSIHLQRTYERLRREGVAPPDAWVQACRTLGVALGLAVLTTVSAFISNVVSPLPPVRTFGLVLATGVISAFLSSTIVVGALHVLVESRGAKPPPNDRGTILAVHADRLTIFHKRNTIAVLVVVILLTVGSIMMAAVRLETEFSLSDFLSDDMEVMEVRDELYDSYESAAWKPIDILIEPTPGSSVITDDETFLTGLWLLDNRIASTHGVVVPTSVIASARPSYDGVYPILRDAVEQDTEFGAAHNLRIVDGDLAAMDGYHSGEIAAALQLLQSNLSVADHLDGTTWSDRVAKSVILINGTGGVAISDMRITIDVEARTSQDSAAVVDRMEDLVANLDADNLIEARFHLDGDIVKLDMVLTGLSFSQIESTAISLTISFLVLLALTRRFGPSILVITPVAMAATWVVGAMALLGMNWNVLTVMVTALTIGLGLDYTIHMWRRFESLVESGSSGWDAMRETLSTTGSSLVISAVTTICGFLILTLSPLPVVRDFGIVTAITVLFSLVLAVLVLPGLLVHEAAGHHSNGD